MTRDDLVHFRSLKIDFDAIGLSQENANDVSYFCTPIGAEYVGSIGSDGVHFILLPDNECVFCVDPTMGEPGSYVLPVGKDFREFLSFLLFCRDANPLSQIWWMEKSAFSNTINQDMENSWPGSEAFFKKKCNALSSIRKEFSLSPVDPFEKVKSLQASFDPSILHFSDEYYDTLGLEQPGKR